MHTETEEPTIVVRAKHDWLRRALAGNPMGAMDGKQYPVAADGTVELPAHVAQHTHPDWELVSGTPISLALTPDGDPIPVAGPLRWLHHRISGFFGKTISGPAPMNWEATFSAIGRAAVPDNAWGEHPDYYWGEYLTAEEAAREAQKPQPLRRTGVAALPAHQRDLREQEVRRQLADAIARGQSPTLPGLYEGMVDPNSTGLAGVIAPPGRSAVPPVTGERLSPGGVLIASTDAPPVAPPPVETAQQLEERLRAGMQAQLTDSGTATPAPPAPPLDLPDFAALEAANQARAAAAIPPVAAPAAAADFHFSAPSGVEAPQPRFPDPRVDVTAADPEEEEAGDQEADPADETEPAETPPAAAKKAEPESETAAQRKKRLAREAAQEAMK